MNRVQAPQPVVGRRGVTELLNPPDVSPPALVRQTLLERSGSLCVHQFTKLVLQTSKFCLPLRILTSSWLHEGMTELEPTRLVEAVR